MRAAFLMLAATLITTCAGLSSSRANPGRRLALLDGPGRRGFEHKPWYWIAAGVLGVVVASAVEELQEDLPVAVAVLLAMLGPLVALLVIYRRHNRSLGKHPP